MKQCFKCHRQQNLTEYYKHSRMADGHLNKCKDCTKKDAWESRHLKHRERTLAYDLARSKTPARIEHRRNTVEAWECRHPDRKRAQNAVSNAVRDGRLFKWPACAIPECESTRPVAHHPDYEQPLQVVWLCQAHHKQAHALIGSV